MNYAASTPWTRPATGGILLALSLLMTWGSYLFGMSLYFDLFDNVSSSTSSLGPDAGRILAATIYLLWVSIEHLAWCLGIHFFTQKLPGMKPHNLLRWTARVAGYLNAGTMLIIALCFLIAAIAADSASEIAMSCIVIALFATFALLIFRAIAAIALGLWMIRFADALKRTNYRTQTWIITIWYGVVLTMLAGLPLFGIVAQFARTSFPTIFDGPGIFMIFFSLIGFPLPYVAAFLYLLARQSPNIATYEGAFPMIPTLPTVPTIAMAPQDLKAPQQVLPAQTPPSL